MNAPDRDPSGCPLARPDAPAGPQLGPGEVLRFATRETSLGVVLVATAPAGLAAVLLGEEPQALADDLRHRFPAARLLADEAEECAAVLAAVAGAVEAPRQGADALRGLPLDIRGTPFQRCVWQALQRIPAGETLSYTEVARRIGSPAAVRAVAGACARNKLALVIPCHRVVRGDGALSGYAWGVARKRALLERERAAS